MKQDSQELLNTGLKPGKPYLGSPSVVERVLRQFLHTLTMMRVDQLQNGGDLQNGILYQAGRLQDILYGRTDFYLSYAFNQPGILGKYLVDKCNMGGDPEDAVVRAGVRIARDFYTHLAAHEQGEISEEEMQQLVDELIGLWTNIMMGKPPAPAGKPTAELQKSYVQGYTRTDGTYVKPHQTKTMKKHAGEPVPRFHPRANDSGHAVLIHKPSQASAESTWHNPTQTATFLPDGNFPLKIGQVPVASWHDHPKTKGGWDYVEGINRELDEPPFIIDPKKHPAAGVIVEEEDGRIWLVSPTNAFGGYVNSFPKGTCEQGLSIQANAIKEAWEESGLKVQIVDVLGDFERTTSVARFYVAKRIGGNPADAGWETQAVRLVPKDKLLDYLNMQPDRDVVDAYLHSKKD